MINSKMNLKISGLILASFCILACGTSCVYINEELGSSFIPNDQRYAVHIDTIMISGLESRVVDKLSGYNSSRMTIGAIRNSDNQISDRSSALTLIPASKYDFGEGGEVTKFHFAVAKDTLSYINEGQRRIIQNVNVYELTKKIGKTEGYISSIPAFSPERITDGIPTYNGGDSLSFNFSNAWANRFLEKLQAMETSAYDSVGAFTEKVFPGIYLSVDEPAAEGGRINLFTITTGADLSEYTLSGGYATMNVKGAKFGDRTVEDTTFMFLYGAQDFSITQAATDYYSGETLTPQYALNVSNPDNIESPDAEGRVIKVGGAGGLKPVISAWELKQDLTSMFEAKGVDPSKVIVNKASIYLSFDEPENYDDLSVYPPVLSPTCRLVDDSNEELISYVGITDSSTSSENKGDINRSLFYYSPDISYHMQEILSDSSESEEDYQEKDIWLLTMSKEIQEEEQEGTSEYYNNLAYSMYYNNLYNYGYGGYGYGYGGYGYGSYGYNNYYDYYAMAAYYSAMQSSSSDTESSTIELDRDRYYDARLIGPNAADTGNSDYKTKDLVKKRLPYMVITYSVRAR